MATVPTIDRTPTNGSGATIASATSERSRVWPRVLRVLRRIHLYLGLLLMPWVLLFAITALSFNHPTVGRGLEGKMLPAEQLQSLTGFSAVDPQGLAESITRNLNGQGYVLEPGSARFSGWPLFVRDSPQGKEVVILGLGQGRAILSRRPAIQQSRAPAFEAQKVSLPEFDMQNVARQLDPIHSKLGISTTGPLTPHPEIHPELRFVVADSQGVAWNVVYNLSTQRVDGRPQAESRHAPVVELLEALHKQHHYPANFGPTFFWALFQDLTALTLAFWAMSGLLMWWQLKKLRVLGALALSIGLVLALLVMGSTASDLTFGPERAATGKGE